MKKYILIFLFFLLQSCQNPKDIVFWCGDHACKNEKERSAYFEKTMLVEIRKIDVKKSRLIDIEKYNKLINEKKEQKRIAKIEKKREKILQKKTKTFTKKNNKKLSKKINKKRVIKKTSDIEMAEVNLDKYLDKHDDFDTIVEMIVSNNQNKPYPSVNDFPE